MVIGVESLHRMFKQHIYTNKCSYSGRCDNCGCNVNVEITKTGRGYGLQGGVLYESNIHSFLILCMHCYEKTDKQIQNHLNRTSTAI